MQIESFLFIFFISLLIFAIAISYLTIFAPALFIFSKIYFWMIVPIFILIVWLILISYWRAGCSDPGYPKQSLKDQYNHKQIENLQTMTLQQVQSKAERRQRRIDQYSEEQIKELTQETYCFKCDNIKQVRVHHCKVCNKCIQRMDHHCPWVGNCVGKYNHKYFLLFLMYATIGLCIVWITILIDWLTNWPVLSHNDSQNKFYAIVLTGIAAFGLSLPIGFLFATQLFTVTINITTLQSFISGIESHNPFHKESSTQNLKEIMGENMCEWPLPIAPSWKEEYTNFGAIQQ